MDASLLFPLRSFLQDLHEQVELHSVSEPLTVYVAETVERASLDCVEEIRLSGNTISWSQYLLGSSDQTRAIDQAKQLSLRNNYSIPLLIRLDIPANGKCLTRLANVENGFDLLLQSDLIWTIVGVENDFQRGEGVALLHLTLVSRQDQMNLQVKIEEKREDIDDVSPLVQLTRLMICNQVCSTAEQFIEELFNDDDERRTSDVHRQESLAKAFHLLGLDQLRNENKTRAQALFRRSLDASLRLTPPDPAELYSIYICLAQVSLSQEDHHSAEKSYAKALDVQRSSSIPDLYAMAHCYDQLGKIYLQTNRTSEALETFTFTLDILEQTTETTEEDLLAIFTSLAHTYMSQKEYPQAILYYSKAIQIEEDSDEPDRQQLALFHRVIADMFKEMNQYEQALHHYQTTVRYCQEYIVAGKPIWIHIYIEIGQMYLQMNEYFDALNSFFQGLLMASSFDQEDESSIGKLLHGVALLFVELGRFDQAKELVEKSTERYQNAWPVDFLQLQTNRSLMSIIEEKQSDQEITHF